MYRATFGDDVRGDCEKFVWMGQANVNGNGRGRASADSAQHGGEDPQGHDVGASPQCNEATGKTDIAREVSKRTSGRVGSNGGGLARSSESAQSDASQTLLKFVAALELCASLGLHICSSEATLFDGFLNSVAGDATAVDAARKLLGKLRVPSGGTVGQ